MSWADTIAITYTIYAQEILLDIEPGSCTAQVRSLHQPWVPCSSWTYLKHHCRSALWLRRSEAFKHEEQVCCVVHLPNELFYVDILLFSLFGAYEVWLPFSSILLYKETHWNRGICCSKTAVFVKRDTSPYPYSSLFPDRGHPGAFFSVTWGCLESRLVWKTSCIVKCHRTHHCHYYYYYYCY